MSETTSAFITKYRPKTLKSVIGQDQAVAQINGMLERNRIPNAILICGPYGTGKTSLGRIIANKINGIVIGENPDLVEINAGTERGINEVRGFIARAQFKPRNKYRVILIDEAHHITSHAATALLKTLEEPPPQTVWILASSNYNDIEKAIRQRCQEILLDSPSVEDLHGLLIHVAKKEDVNFGKKHKSFLLKIATLATGNPREGLGLLEKIINIYASGKDAKSALEKVKHLENLFVTPDRIALKMLYSIYKGNGKMVLKTITDISDRNYVSIIGTMLSFNSMLINYIAGVFPYLIPVMTPLKEQLQPLPSVKRALHLQNLLNDTRREMMMYSANPMSVMQAKLALAAYNANKKP